MNNKLVRHTVRLADNVHKELIQTAKSKDKTLAELTRNYINQGLMLENMPVYMQTQDKDGNPVFTRVVII